jgi:hypothetical protein
MKRRYRNEFIQFEKAPPKVGRLRTCLTTSKPSTDDDPRTRWRIYLCEKLSLLRVSVRGLAQIIHNVNDEAVILAKQINEGNRIHHTEHHPTDIAR